jgi:membrane-associated protease RseP (regulator of RpoE activity)
MRKPRAGTFLDEVGPMADPYRTQLSVDTDPLPDRCIPADERACDCPLHAPRRLGASGLPFAQALSMAATLLLLVGSASLGAVTWTVTTTILEARQLPHARSPGPRVAQRTPRLDRTLSALGPETHDADALWTRAERLAAEDRAVTLVRATVAPDALDALRATARVEPVIPGGGRGLPRERRGGVRVASAEPGSLPALLGLRPGDVVTAVDGIALRRPGDVTRALAGSTLSRGVVVELRRGRRWIVMRLDAARV